MAKPANGPLTDNGEHVVHVGPLQSLCVEYIHITVTFKIHRFALWSQTGVSHYRVLALGLGEKK